MKISELIAYADAVKPNAFDTATKIIWINEIEGMVQTEVMMVALANIIQYLATDTTKTLLVPAPHDKMYRSYLSAMIEFANGDYDKYNNSMQMFNMQYEEYSKWYRREYSSGTGSIADIITFIDTLKPNKYEDSIKVVWLNEVEGRVQSEILWSDTIITYSDTDMATVPLVPAPHNKLYRSYLLAKTEFTNGEYDKYKESMLVFETQFAEYKKWYTKNYIATDGSIADILSYADTLKPNNYDSSLKISWISTLEGRIQIEIMLIAVDAIVTYSETELSTIPLVPAPYNELYKLYLLAMMDLYGEDYKKYQQSIALFNDLLREYTGWYARTYRPADR